MNHETSQFEDWPLPLAQDLRILRRTGDERDDYRMVLMHFPGCTYTCVDGEHRKTAGRGCT